MTLCIIVGLPGAYPRLFSRVAFGAAAFAATDLIVGIASFSVITTGALWYFSLGWIRLQAEFAARGLPFGAAWQLDLAWLGFVGGLPLLVLVLYLTREAIRLPPRIYRRGVR